MKNLLYITLLLTSVMQLQACKKADQLTPETQTGANTFSCKINGAIYKPGDFQIFGAPSVYGSISTYNGNVEVYIFSSNTTPRPPVSFEIDINNITTTGTYTLINSQLTFQYKLGNQIYYGVNGTLTLNRFDAANHIVSGTFNFTGATKENPNDTVQITEGRFDITTDH